MPKWLKIISGAIGGSIGGAIILAASTAPVTAADISFSGFADLRLISTSDERSWINGGDGRYRFGEGDAAVYGELYLDTRAQITSSLSAHVVLRAEPDQRRPVDIIESYMRWRPVSTSPVRWSVKAGIFFPPISLENDEIGWTSPWTLTSSALNSWVGEELRTIGSEIRMEWRRPDDTIEVYASVYGWGDPAGIILADRGWALHDRPTGLLDRLRLPDAWAEFRGIEPPLKTLTFKEIDDTPGWYAGVSWTRQDVGGLHVMRYNNQADPTSFRQLFGWRTRFWSAGAEVFIGPLTILAQTMRGVTIVQPRPTFRSETRFWSTYVLAGLDLGEWRLAARHENFGTEELTSPFAPDPWEKGTASTFAVSWLPKEWIRITGEALTGKSIRDIPLAHGEGLENRETQLQLSARFYF